MNEFLKMINLAVSDAIISSEYRRNPETGTMQIKQTRLSLNPREVEEWIRTGEESFYGP